MSKARTLIGFILLVSLASGCATSGVIRGRLNVPGPPGKAADAVVYLEQVPARVETLLARNALEPVIGQTGDRFAPRVLPVAAGSTVRFENRDHVYHNVFSISPTRRFDIGKYAPRATRSVRFEKPGVVKLYCDIHPASEGFILVLSHHAFAQPDATGSFALPRLPRGAYTLKVWHPTLGRITRKVEMPSRGDTLVTLSY